MPRKINTKVRKNSPFRKISPLYLIILVVVLLAGWAGYKGWIIAALVNGQLISRFTIISQLEKQSGKRTLDSEITKVLVQQEINRQKITASPQDIDNEVKKIENSVTSQGQNFNELLSGQGLTRQGLREQIRLQLSIEKILGKDASVSAQEIDQYIKDNKDIFPSGTTADKQQEMAKQQLLQSKINEKFQTWLDDLNKKAKITRFVQF